MFFGFILSFGINACCFFRLVFYLSFKFILIVYVLVLVGYFFGL